MNLFDIASVRQAATCPPKPVSNPPIMS